MKKINKTSFVNAALISTIVVTGVAQAQENPFEVTELSSGYMQVAEMACGAGMKMEKPKAPEGACAGNKATTPATTKSSEGKCGDMMDGDKMKKGMENACGAMMKGKEGACGEMHGSMKGKEGACGEAAPAPIKLESPKQ